MSDNTSTGMELLMSLEENIRECFIRDMHQGEVLRLSAERSAEHYTLDDRALCDLYGQSVAVPTERGEMVGTLLGEVFAHLEAMHIGPVAVVYLPTSGSVVQMPSSRIRPASDSELRRAERHMEMAERIVQHPAAASSKGPVETLLDAARAAGFEVAEAGGYYKVPGTERRCIYLSKNGRRIDLSGFTVEHPLVRAIFEDEAAQRKLGRVRGQATDVQPESLPGLWQACLAGLRPRP